MAGSQKPNAGAEPGSHQRATVLIELECSICVGDSFQECRVLWSDQVAEWKLGPEEVAYVNRQ